MAAEDVIAEALWASVDDTGVKGRLYQVDTQYLAAVAVQAIRNLSPDDLAELVGGGGRVGCVRARKGSSGATDDEEPP